MNIVITGSQGFLGRELTSFILNKIARNSLPVNIIEMDLAPHQTTGQDVKDITRFHYQGAVKNNLLRIKEDFSRLDVFVHLAGVSRSGHAERDPYEAWNSNTVETLEVLEFLRKHSPRCHFILASTRDVLRSQGMLLDQEIGGKIYSLSKNWAEIISKAYAEKFKIKVDVLRFGDLYGSAGDHPSKVYNIVFKKIIQKLPYTINDPSMVFNFFNIQDACEKIFSLCDLQINEESIDRGGFERHDCFDKEELTLGELEQLFRLIIFSPKTDLERKILASFQARFPKIVCSYTNLVEHYRQVLD